MNRVHVCLVSAQPIPNLIPLRMEELRPEKVILLVSPDMKLQAERLEKIIKGWVIKTEKISIAPYDLESARETCIEALLRHDNDEIILNATGGTKIMAFAAFEVFREKEKPVVYVDTQNNYIDFLSPERKKLVSRGVMKVPIYLASYGQNIVSETNEVDVPDTHWAAVEAIIQEGERLERGISILNRYVAPLRNARTFPFEIDIEDEDFKNVQFQGIVSILSRYGLLTLKENYIQFPSLSSVEFSSGGWLEEHIFKIVKSLNPTDVRMNVKVKWARPSESKNEYDVLLTHSNRLFIIECKTKRFSGKDISHFGEDSIYKLDSLRDAAGGLYGKGMLVSFRRLTDEQKRRLKTNKLEFCEGQNIKNLKEIIKQWIQK